MQVLQTDMKAESIQRCVGVGPGASVRHYRLAVQRRVWADGGHESDQPIAAGLSGCWIPCAFVLGFLPTSCFGGLARQWQLGIEGDVTVSSSSSFSTLEAHFRLPDIVMFLQTSCRKNLPDVQLGSVSLIMK